MTYYVTAIRRASISWRGYKPVEKIEDLMNDPIEALYNAPEKLKVFENKEEAKAHMESIELWFRLDSYNGNYQLTYDVVTLDKVDDPDLDDEPKYWDGETIDFKTPSIF